MPCTSGLVHTVHVWSRYANYSEGLLVGYRYYDAHGIEPAFPFGHGLSYTAFDYKDLVVSGTTVSF